MVAAWRAKSQKPPVPSIILDMIGPTQVGLVLGKVAHRSLLQFFFKQTEGQQLAAIRECRGGEQCSIYATTAHLHTP